MAVDFVSANVPGLAPSQRAFQLATGETVIVECVRIAPKPEDQFVNLKITAWQAETTGARVSDGGVPVQIPGHVRSVSISGLADGTLTIENEIADSISQSLARFRNHLVAMNAWKQVPVEDEKATT